MKAVDGLINLYKRTSVEGVKRELLTTLIRLYHKEGDWDGRWWGTRPDTTGPYYRRVTWEASERIGAVITVAMQTDKAAVPHILKELQRHRVNLGDTTKLMLAMAAKDPAFAPTVLDLLLGGKSVPGEAIPLLKQLATTGKGDVRVRAVQGLLRVGNRGGLDLAVDALKERGSAADTADWLRARQAFIRDRNHVKQSAYFVGLTGQSDAGRNVLGYAVLLNIAKQRRLKADVRQNLTKTLSKAWLTTGSTVSLLYAIGEMKDRDYAAQIRNLIVSEKLEVRKAAESAAKLMNLLAKRPKGTTLESMKFDAVVARLLTRKGKIGRAHV